MLEDWVRFNDGFPGLIDMGMVFIKESDYGNDCSLWGGGMIIMPDIAFDFE